MEEDIEFNQWKESMDNLSSLCDPNYKDHQDEDGSFTSWWLFYDTYHQPFNRDRRWSLDEYRRIEKLHLGVDEHLQGLEKLELDTNMTLENLQEGKICLENEEILEKTRRENEEEMLRIRSNYEESLRRTEKNPNVIYELNAYEDCDDTSDPDD